MATFTHSQHPLLSVFFMFLSVLGEASVMAKDSILYIADISALDAKYFAPGAHVFTALSGLCAFILFCITIKEKYWNKKK